MSYVSKPLLTKDRPDDIYANWREAASHAPDSESLSRDFHTNYPKELP